MAFFLLGQVATENRSRELALLIGQSSFTSSPRLLLLLLLHCHLLESIILSPHVLSFCLCLWRVQAEPPEAGTGVGLPPSSALSTLGGDASGWREHSRATVRDVQGAVQEHKCVQDWQPYPVDPSSWCMCVIIHTYISILGNKCFVIGYDYLLVV